MEPDIKAMLAEAWDRGHFYCARCSLMRGAELGDDSPCRNPYRASGREEILRQIAPDRYVDGDF